MRPELSGDRGRTAELQARLSHVHWIGSGSGAGKSTVARRLARQHGLDVYSTDDAMADHDSRVRREDAPLLARFKVMTMDERWVDRSPQVMLDTFHWSNGELFSLIVEDLLRLPAGHGVVAEGFRLLPRLVKPLLGQHGHAVWLQPTPEFRRAALASRGSLGQIAGKTSNPGQALRNLLERDRMFTDLLARETRRLGLPAIEITAAMSEDHLTGQATEILGL